MTIDYALYRNKLTGEDDLYSARTMKTGSADTEQIIDRIVQQGSTLTTPDVAAVLQSAFTVIARMLLEGFSPKGSHEAEVAFMMNMGFPEAQVSFMNQLRYFRNRIKYYGRTFDQAYAEKVLAFMDDVIPILEEQLDEPQER